MKVLHTSDWHIGRTLYGRKRYEEFGAFLTWLAETIQQNEIDALLVAGDIFDTSAPSNRAQELYYRFLCRVPASITLDRLHDVIQIVMGWTDSHLNEFTIGNKRYTEYPESKEDGLVCGRYRLGDLIKQKGRTFRYLYDFGDSWEHELALEENRYFNPELRTELACLEGERACPPEDVGGAPGYFEFCNALKVPSYEEHESYMEWSGGDFDSEQFDSESVNWELIKYLRWSRDRYQNWGGVE